jgi:glucose/arabinose dehydrogenase
MNMRNDPRLSCSVRRLLLGLAILALLPAAGFAASSLRFHGNGAAGVDRVRIAVDDPSNSNPGPPVDVGATDFTLEFWMKAAAADNTAASVVCGSNADWVHGNVVVDRDRTGDRKFGLSIAGGVVVFGVSGDGTGDLTICGSRNVLDGFWHHVAVERERSSGKLWTYVDGVLDAQGDGPGGDVSYPDDAAASDPNDPFLVLGAEKYDLGPQDPPYDGELDELRLSTTLRYTSEFTRPRAPFAPDAQTAALYHLDEATGDAITDSSGAAGGPSNGTREYGGSPAGPEWVTEVAPLGGMPSLTLTALPGTLSLPVHVTHAGDGSGRLFVVEQTGRIRIFQNNQFLATPFLDVSALISCCGEQGLLSVAFHPDYASNGYFYIYYIDNIGSPGDITVARYHVSSDPNVADPNSAQILLVVSHPVYDNHNGGQLAFGPDGYLYMGTGDGGGGGDPGNNAQNLTKMLGKMMRLDVDASGAIPCGQSAPAPYGIPPSNPFASSPTDCKEIWAYGVRNPWRFGFDRSTGDLIIGDVGQNNYEEVDFQAAGDAGGENYGWRRMEGLHCYNPPVNCNDGTLTLPILEYNHSTGDCAIIGGFRYRGTTIPGLVGTYLYGDECSGRIRAATQSGDGSWNATILQDTALSISSFGEDEPGEMYVANLGGTVYRIEPTPYPAPTTTSLSPTSVIAGGAAFPLTVHGTGFTYESVVRWNGSDRPTTFVSSSQLTAQISAIDIDAAATASVQVFTPPPGGGLSNAQTFTVDLTFLDVPTSHFAYAYVQAVFNAGVTAGCGARMYCPDASVTRAQMAVFLLKASQGSGYVPPACEGVFDDVPCPSLFADWIEDVAARGITGGCNVSPPLYCPDAAVTRAQMAPFLLKTEHGSGYLPPACAGVFGDVPCPSLFADWIEQLVTENITAGCGGGDYCPADPVTRAQMAVFLTKTFGLPLP